MNMSLLQCAYHARPRDSYTFIYIILIYYMCVFYAEGEQRGKQNHHEQCTFENCKKKENHHHLFKCNTCRMKHCETHRKSHNCIKVINMHILTHISTKHLFFFVNLYFRLCFFHFHHVNILADMNYHQNIIKLTCFI